MTSKLRRTIVGVGIALGGAAPACFGRTDVAGDLPTAGEPDNGPDASPNDAGSRDARPADAAPPDRKEPSEGGLNMPDATDAMDASDGGPSMPDAADASADGTDATTDASADGTDAATDAAIDPFCDVSWPPTKGNNVSGPVACVDPLHECANRPVPYRCYRLIEPYVCDPRETRVGPLYCIGGLWRCGPGNAEETRCHCYGPLPPGQTCPDPDAGTDAASDAASDAGI